MRKYGSGAILMTLNMACTCWICRKPTLNLAKIQNLVSKVTCSANPYSFHKHSSILKNRVGKPLVSSLQNIPWLPDRCYGYPNKLGFCANFSFFKLGITSETNCKWNKKNPAYGRERISGPMRIVGPIQFWRGCVIYLKNK